MHYTFVYVPTDFRKSTLYTGYHLKVKLMYKNKHYSIMYCKNINGERSGIVVEHQTPNQEVLGSIPIGGTVLCL